MTTTLMLSSPSVAANVDFCTSNSNTWNLRSSLTCHASNLKLPLPSSSISTSSLPFHAKSLTKSSPDVEIQVLPISPNSGSSCSSADINRDKMFQYFEMFTKNPNIVKDRNEVFCRSSGASIRNGNNVSGTSLGTSGLECIPDNQDEHRELLESSDEMIYKCMDCDRAFQHIQTLHAHRQMHLGRTECPFCKKVFSNIGNKNVHIKMHHP